VAAITINHENLGEEEIPKVCREIEEATGLPTFDVLRDGAEELVKVVEKYAKSRTNGFPPARE